MPSTILTRFCLVYLLSLPVLASSSPAWGAPRAWLIDSSGAAAKLDPTQHRVMLTDSLSVFQTLPDELAVDPVRGLLFATDGRGPYQIRVYDLKTLNPRGVLGFAPDMADDEESVVRFVFPPTGNEFYVRWSKPNAVADSEVFVVSTVNATTFKTITTRTTTPPLEGQLMLDDSGKQVYSMTAAPWDKPARIDVFALPNFTRTSTIDLEAVLSPTAFGRAIDDFAKGKVLIGENEKALRSDPDHVTFFVFDVATRQSSPKMHTGLKGDGKLLPRTNRMLFVEELIAASGPHSGAPISPGRIHVYDTLTGNRIGLIQIPVKITGWYVGVNPSEDTLYYLTDRPATPGRPEPLLAVVNLKTLSIVKEFAVPVGADKIVFFDE